MGKILITPRSFGKHSKKPFELLKQRGFELVVNPYGRILTQDEMIKEVADVDGIIIGVDPLNAEVLKHAKKLKVISKYGVGTDNIDLNYAKNNNITITITKGANSDAVADYAFALMISVARKIVTIDRGCRKLDWSKVTSIGMYGKTLGLIGLGNIGKGVAKRAKGFDMKVLAYDVYKDMNFASRNNVQYVTIEKILKEADFISIHLPLTKETKYIIGEKELNMMKENAVIVNTARGGLIDENALYDALKNNRIWGAGIDVFEQEPPKNKELLDLNNIVVGSHCAASTFEAVDNMGIMAANNIIENIK
ncbi:MULTISPECIES: phosphoglycerate dehydrogenase [Clostridium]|uniref:Glycerate dehydrogenase n=4 Tax=Clostridium TaxID=1485 RepID=D8GR92_CLOLD|nr:MULTISPECIES: phosphoglycerate dehydrogenase [Clostridium]ADK14230.1 putative D-isomer specific 2-hydroxyacid dehydrogenase family protein [Clostridium ljungdahlii DSM 13528]AGY77456.1 phosphoglycerate dehydrogenase [Clostridium autoethanogenum DSM 10061]ALU37597.1 Phosphoglycerate dehydrogenase [Clostridium autoethanogenum DSM 10061]OAA86093.1 Glycerate dehydrogenase [Clostridium ljungdahlii DSM 13528]OAA92271.1 Glycerate dehydrogenase [Clostridium coskatii]